MKLAKVAETYDRKLSFPEFEVCPSSEAQNKKTKTKTEKRRKRRWWPLESSGKSNKN